MKILTSILFFFFLSTLNSQTMYLESVSKVRKRTFTYSKSDDQKLKLDFYKPRNFRDSLPLIVYVHGGGF